jgi:hypothetical protein
VAVGSSNKGRTETHGEGTLNCREAHSSDTLEHNICTHKISNKLQVKIRCKRRHGRRKSGYMYLRMSLSRPTYLVKANGVPVPECEPRAPPRYWCVWPSQYRIDHRITNTQHCTRPRQKSSASSSCRRLCMFMMC